jgi:hypothetical protein
MLKTLMTLARGTSARAARAVGRPARAAHPGPTDPRRGGGARPGQAGAGVRGRPGRGRGETDRGGAGRHPDLEERATAALDTREDLATEAADAIAGLEIDLAAAQSAHAGFARENARLRQLVRNGERRLTDLERGRRTAQAAEAVRRLRTRGMWTLGANASALRDAEATLERLRRNQ